MTDVEQELPVYWSTAAECPRMRYVVLADLLDMLPKLEPEQQEACYNVLYPEKT